jgi:hypothetical protein
MGNSVATPKELSDTVYDSISKSIVQSMQTAQSQVFSSQSVNINCDDSAIAAMTDDVNKCRDILITRGIDKNTINKLCQPAIKCIANNVSIKSSLNVTDLTNQTSSIQSNINSSLSDNVSQDLTNNNSALSLSGKDKTSISDITNKVSINTANILQQVQTNVTQQQGLTLDNYEANNITMTAVTDIVAQNVQNIDGVQSIVTDLSNSIVQKLSNNTDNLTTWVTRIFISAMAIILLMFFILFVVKRPDTRDFILMILPYVIFGIVTVIIVVLHLIFKPSYILLDNHEKYRQIDRGKFIFWVGFYAIIFGAGEIIYYRYIKNRQTK